MADYGTNNYLVDPNAEVKALNLDAKIQERVSRIARIRQDIEDLEKMAIVSKKAELKMLELELKKLKDEKAHISPQEADIIEVQGGSNG